MTAHPEREERRIQHADIQDVVINVVTIAACMAYAYQVTSTRLVVLVVATIGIGQLWFSARPHRRWKDGTLTDLLHLGISSGLTGLVTAGVVVAIAIPLRGYLSSPLSVFHDQPLLLQTVEVVIFADFLTWACHWAEHHFLPLWRFHAVHHSSVHLDMIAAFRVHPFMNGVVSGIAILPVSVTEVLPAFPTLAISTLLLVMWQHSNTKWEGRWLSILVVTPGFHCWHHANDAAAFGKNLGVIFTVWDRLFGTFYYPTRRPEAFGISESMPPGYLAQLSRPFVLLVRRTPGKPS